MEYNYDNEQVDKELTQTKQPQQQPEADISKITIIRAFNKHFFEFLDDLLRILPKNVEILSGKMSAELINKFSINTLIKGWYKYVVLPYENIINEGDLTFFFDKDYNVDLEHLSNSNEILKCINNFRGPIKQLNGENLIHTTKYIQNLTKLSKIYSNK